MEMPSFPREASAMSVLDERNVSKSTLSTEAIESRASSTTTTMTMTGKAPSLDAATVSTYASNTTSSTISTLAPPQQVSPEGSKSYRLEEKENLPQQPNLLPHPVSMDETTDTASPPHYPHKQYNNNDHTIEDNYPNADDLSSSDDDSSYFATQLPAPNSRRGSYISGASASPYINNNCTANESNASLSFSDDESDDAMIPNPHLLNHNGSNKDLFSDPITRIHSIDSLVSSASSDNEYCFGGRGGNSPDMIASHLYQEALPRLLDGRQAPIMGQQHPHYYPSPTQSPTPMIMQGYIPSSSGHVIHQPQPQRLAQPVYGSTLLASQAGQQPQLYMSYGSYQSDKPNESFSSRGPPTMNGGVGDSPSQTQPIRTAGSNNDTMGDMKSAVAATGGSGGGAGALVGSSGGKGFKVYWQRWIMLMYMSVLNLLSDWTCYSVAPIALLTEKAFGNIDPERLVVVFLGANAVASACEPIILARLGLRKTVLFGALLLMIGSSIKSGGIPPIIPSDLRVGHDEWRLYLGFFLVGLSQPLYQCTPALLSASWFPEKERTMATGVALNANQLGIGFAFVFGTLLVSEADDIPNYFGLLTLLSTVVFLGTLIQFDDAPPTPPSSSARVMRGTMEINLPKFEDIMQSVRNFGGSEPSGTGLRDDAIAAAPSPAVDDSLATRDRKGNKSTRRRGKAQRMVSSTFNAPSPALEGSTADAEAEIARLKSDSAQFSAAAPSPAMDASSKEADDSSPLYSATNQGQNSRQGLNMPPPQMGENASQGYPPQGMMGPYGVFPPYQYPYSDPRFQQQMQQQQAAYQQFYYYQQQQQQQLPPQQLPQVPPVPYYFTNPYLEPHLQGYDWQHTNLPAAGAMDEGAEPVITMTPHHLDIEIRDDQVLLSIRACLSRPGFVHALVAFTVSGIVINTLSTYMDYLVRLNGAPRYYTGVIGGTFQLVIMISSLIIGKQTDKTRAYYSVTIGMLVLGAFGLAECGVSLDSNNGRDLRWSLVIVAALVGPLQPVSTELGVDVAYPLSENTVLVIQQLFSNLLSALFIPIFKALKDIGKGDDDEERPEYTFSFYLLIVLHTAATVFFATFNGKYLRYEHELEKKEQEEEEEAEARLAKSGTNAFHPFYADGATAANYGGSFESERQPLVGD